MYIMGFLIVATTATNIYLSSQLKHQKDMNFDIKLDLIAAKVQNKNLRANNDFELNKIASEFVSVLFTYKPGQKEKPSELAQKLSIGKAKEQLTQSDKEANEGHSESVVKDFDSNVEDVNTSYNKTGSDTAQVEVNFDQILKIDGGPDARTKNKMVLNVRYTGANWMVEDYKLQKVY